MKLSFIVRFTSQAQSETKLFYSSTSMKMSKAEVRSVQEDHIMHRLTYAHNHIQVRTHLHINKVTSKHYISK